jgi:hypothetical protein
MLVEVPSSTEALLSLRQHVASPAQTSWPAPAQPSRMRIHNIAISLDEYGAGPRWTDEEPLGMASGYALGTPDALFLGTRGKSWGTTEPDDDVRGAVRPPADALGR